MSFARPTLGHLPSALWALARAPLMALLTAFGGLGVGGVTHAQDLPAPIEAALQRAGLPRDALALWVSEVDPSSPPRVAHRTKVQINPASLTKLVTTYAGLDLLGPGFTWSTAAYADGPVRDGVLQGNLFLRGTGDPKLVMERLWLLLRRVQGMGVRSIQGDIVLDRSAFEVPEHDPGAFDGEPLRPYNVAPDALLINFKSTVFSFTPDRDGVAVHMDPPLSGVEWPRRLALAPGDCGDWRARLKADFSDPVRVRFAGAYAAACGERAWPVAYAAPAQFAARAVGGVWAELGGKVGGTVRDGRVPAGLAPWFDQRSLGLAELVRDINKFSNNVMAEQLFLTLGQLHGGAGSAAGAQAAVRKWWRDRLGEDGVMLNSGSGLSRSSTLSAEQLARLLRLAWASPLMPEFVGSLPMAGVDGTAQRMRGTGTGNAHLKTGSLRDVAAIAGYVHGPGARRWVLVAVINHPQASGARAVLEAALEWTSRQGR